MDWEALLSPVQEEEEEEGGTLVGDELALGEAEQREEGREAARTRWSPVLGGKLAGGGLRFRCIIMLGEEAVELLRQAGAALFDISSIFFIVERGNVSFKLAGELFHSSPSDNNGTFFLKQISIS